MIAVAHPSEAAARPLVTDPAGDARVPLAGLDLLSGNVMTAGSDRTTHGPTSLVASVTLAAPPVPGEQVRIRAAVLHCPGPDGSIDWDYYAATQQAARDAVDVALGSADVFLRGCGVEGTTALVVPAQVVLNGSTVTWTVSLSSFHGRVRRGTAFHRVHLSTDQNDPLSAEIGTGIGYSDSPSWSMDDAIATRDVVLR